MFERKTVLILGAGASKPFGYPLGPEIITNIVNGIRKEVKDSETDSFSWSSAEANFIKYPYRALARYLEFSGVPFSPGMIDTVSLKKLADDLDRASFQSIDDFARANPASRALVRILICLEIARATFDPNAFGNGSLQVKPSLFSNSRNTWYGRLVSKLRDRCSNEAECYARPLNVITFNYDQSLELYLAAELNNAEIFKSVDYEKVVRILHIHGSVEFSEKRATTFAKHFGDMLTRDAGKFLLMGDDRDEKSHRVMTMARAVLDDAERIFIFGFDLHQQNVELLDLQRSYVAKRTVVVNWDGSQRVRDRAAQLGIRNENVLNGSRAQPLELADALGDGIFERRAYLP